MKQIIGILGTTCVGKSAVSVEVAKLLNSQIISCDSMQVYSGMDIGTAKITEKEKQGIAHHMLDVVLPSEKFSAFDYQQMVTTKVFPIFEEKNINPIVVGGTGLYYNSLIFGLDFNTDSNTQEIRQELNSLYQKEGIASLLDILKELDLPTYDKIDKNNAKRVIRAIEIAKSGESLYGGKKKEREIRYANKLFILETEREKLYQDINSRVDKMIELGLIEEVKSIYKTYGDNTNSLQAIGYKEIIAYLNGSATKEDAISKIKQNTRHYAKRQITFFKQMNGTHIDVQNKTHKEIADIIVNSSI